MGFASNSCSFTRFRILDPVTDEVLLAIPQKLIQYAFKDIDDIPETRSFGWVSFEDMLDSEWLTAPPQKGQYAVFSLRLDTRRIPPAVIKKHVTLALKGEKSKLESSDRKFVPRERKIEIRERVLLNLRQRFLPVPAEFNVVWNLRTNDVWFASIQDKMTDLFMEYFLLTFNLHLERLTPFSLASIKLDESRMTILESLQPTMFNAASPRN